MLALLSLLANATLMAANVPQPQTTLTLLTPGNEAITYELTPQGDQLVFPQVPNAAENRLAIKVLLGCASDTTCCRTSTKCVMCQQMRLKQSSGMNVKVGRMLKAMNFERKENNKGTTYYLVPLQQSA